MKTSSHVLKFSTPAFLGNAEWKGVWRTPPIKALLRQWWRVAYAAQAGFFVDISAMRSEEAALFGHADNEGASRSLVRLRLDRWDEGKLKKWETLDKIRHPEVSMPVDAGLYSGYGPITLPKGEKTPQLKANAAIQAGEYAELRLAYPENHGALLEQALWLMDRFGVLGGRSRNGWGSFFLEPENGEPLTGMLPLRNWEDCLDRDWPHAIGQNEGGALIWQTQPKADWKRVMVELAKLKIGLRTQFIFPDERPPHHDVLPRHWLSYPITKHSTQAFPRDARLPNSLRFKVRPAENGHLVGVIFHVPCLPPPVFHPDRNLEAIKHVWQQVHAFLDDRDNGLSRIPE